MPGAEWFPGARLSYAEHIFRGRDDDAVAIRHASELRPLGELTWGELRARAGAIAGGAARRSASGAATASPRTCRTSPRRSPRSSRCASIGAIWSSCSPDFGARSVVDRFAQIEPKVLLAVDGYRYGGTRLRPRARPSRRSRDELPALERTRRPPVPRRRRAGGRLLGAARRRARVRAAAVRPPALGPLLARARPACRRRSSTATAASCSSTSRSCTCTSTRSAGDRVFWFTTTGWMMWNFLVGVLLTDGVDRALRRQPGAPRPRHALGSRRRAPAITCFGTSAGVHRRVHEGRRRAGARAATSRALRSVGSTGSPLVARGLRLGLRRARRRHLALLDERRHRRLHRVRRRRADAARLRGRAAGARARREGRGLGRGRARRWSARSASSSSPSRCRRCRSTSGATPDGSRLPRELLRRCTRASGATATGSRSPSAARRSSTAAPTRRSTAAACAWARARSTARCSRSTRSSTRSSSTCRARRRQLDAAVRRAARRRRARRRRSSRGSRGASARTARRATCPTRCSPIAGGPAHAVGQGARGAGQADPDGRGRRSDGGEPRLAREPGRARLVRGVRTRQVG